MKLISIVLGIVLFTIPLKADNTNLRSIHQIASQSNLVVVGTITAITSAQVTVGNDVIIRSDLTVTINETLLGSASSPLTITVDGGTVSGVTMVSSAYPIMAKGMRAVFFLSTASMGKRTIIGKGLGFKLLNTDDTVYNQRGLTLALIRLQVM